MGCFPGSLDKRDSKLSSLVPKIVIFLLMAVACLWVSGPDAGSELRSDIMTLISSASFNASLYSFTHESPEDPIDLTLREFDQWLIKKENLIGTHTCNNKLYAFDTNKTMKIECPK